MSLVPDLSVVIPAYNEEVRIGPTLGKVSAYLTRRGIEAEVVVVDDGSWDATVRHVEDAARELPVRVLRNGINRGRGFSIKRGCLEASGRVILSTDADLSTPIEEVDHFVSWLDRGYDVVIGSRSLDPRTVKRRQPPYRERMGLVFNRLVQALVLRGIADTQCGFKAFSAPAAGAIFPRLSIDRFCSDVEALVVAHRLGFRIREEPVAWYDSPMSRVRLLRDPLNMVFDLIRIFQRYGLTRLPPRQ